MSKTHVITTTMNRRELTEKIRGWVVMVAIGLLLLAALFPQNIFAASYDVAGWVPWWSEEAGAESALENLDELDVIYPFVFEVSAGGIPVSKVDLADDHWQELFMAARAEDVPIIPTFAWFDGPAMDQVLGNDTWRSIHVQLISLYTQLYGFDGVNIDYEQKQASTMDDFSTFLAELKDELGDRYLTCTVEARMRPEDRWRPENIPDEIEYANDYDEMNRHCDWVEIMAYDQQRADLTLNDERKGVPYSPVADVDWVEKVLGFALEDFDEDEVMLGVPTYGRAWDITVASEWYRDYDMVATLNHPRILELAEKYEVPIGRTDGGEAVITYFPEDSVWGIFNQLPTPEGTPTGFEAAAKALLVATYADIEIPVRMVTWSDAEAIEQKLDLVNKYDLRGAAIFKVDGEEDQDIWELF